MSKLKKDFSVNIVCTGSMLCSTESSIEVLNFQNYQVYNILLQNSSISTIGRKTTQAFWGTRTEMKKVIRKRFVRQKTGIKKVKRTGYKNQSEIDWLSTTVSSFLVYFGIVFWM